MKIFNTALFRAFIALIAGGLMIEYREQMVTWLTIGIGVMFFLSGLISIVAYYVGNKKFEKAMLEATKGENPELQASVIGKPNLPFVGLGSLILGLILCFMPTTFTNALVYIFAAIIIIGAIGEYASLVTTISAIRDFKATLKDSVDTTTIPHCGFIYWVVPTLLLLFGIYAVLDPISIKSAPFLFVGIAMVIYGCSEIVNAIKFHSVHKTIAKESAARGELRAVVEHDNDIKDAEVVG